MSAHEYKEKILAYYKQHRRMPSYAEIMELVGFKSKNAVAKLVSRLIEEGIISKDLKGKLVPVSDSMDIPLLGLVEAGIPSIADSDQLDSISLDNYLVTHRDRTFLLEVKGDSMIEAHIEEGDLVIAERTENPKVDDIVIAEVDGEWTLKYFKKDPKTKRPFLMPANKNYRPIYPERTLRIAAIVKGVIRKY